MIAYITEFKAIKRILSVVLTLCILFALSACKDNTEDKKPDGGKKPAVSTPADSDTGSSTDADSSEDSTPVVGTKFDVSESVIEYRSDYAEVRAENIQPNMYDPLVGYKDAEADAMREKILNTGNTEEYYEITGTKYYVSPGGNDENDGKSPETALRTIDALLNVTLNPGDAVLFERGSIFRLSSTLELKEGVTYGSYGSGDKPQIYGSPFNYAAGDYWEPTKVRNVWKAEYLYEFIGCAVYNHGEIVGNLRYDPVKLKTNGDFYNAEKEGAVYIYCDKGNPSKAFESIEFAAGRTMLTGRGVGNYVVDNLCLKYGGFGVTSKGTKSNVYVTNCEMAYIGGYTGNGTARKGNAFEVGGNSDNIVVDNNWIYQIYDTAITWQTDADYYKNIYFTNNLLEYNTMDIEYFSKDGCVVENVKTEGNLMRFTAAGWGCRASDAGTRNGAACVRGNTSNLKIKNISFTNNIVDCPRYFIFQLMNTPAQNNQMKFTNNTYYIKSSYRTSDVMISSFKMNDGDDFSDHKATNASEFKSLFSYFDPNVNVYWYN